MLSGRSWLWSRGSFASLVLVFWDSDPTSVIKATPWSPVSPTPLARGPCSVGAAVIVTDMTEARGLARPTRARGKGTSESGPGPPWRVSA